MYLLCVWVESESGSGFVGNVGSEVIVILGPGLVGSSGDLGVIEGLVGGEVVNLVLHTGIETGNSGDEHLDDVVQDSVLLLSSEPLGFVFFSLNLKSVDGVVEGGSTLEVNLPSLVFVGVSGHDLDQEVILVGDLGSLFLVQVLKFLLGVVQPGNQVPGGSDLVLLQIFDGVLQVLLELVNHIEELLSDVSLVGTGTHSLELQLTLVVVVGLIVPLSSFGVNVFSELGELLQGLGIEKVGISLELGGTILKLSEVNVGLGNDVDDVFSEESDDLKSFLVLLKSLDEHEVSITSLFSEIISLLVDVVSSVVDPSKVLSGNLNLVLNVLSVGGGLVTDLLVGVSNEGEV